MEIKINELTQAMAEQLIDLIPDGQMSAIRYQGEFVKAAFGCGWVEGEMPIARKDVVALYGQLRPIWTEANEVPNA